MPYRKISISIWNDVWYVDLSKEAKLLFLYLITNTMCNQAGMYRVSLKKIEFETSIPQEDLPKIFRELQDKVEFYEEEKIVWVKNFFRYQATNKLFMISAIRSIKDFPEEFINKWLKYNWDLLIKQLSLEEIQHLISSVSDGILDGVSNGVLDRGSDTLSNSNQTSIKRESDTSTDNSIQNNSNQLTENSNQITESNIVPSSYVSKHSSNNRGDDKRNSTTKCPCLKIVELYHEILPELPRVKALTDLRRRLLQARWKEYPDRQNLDWWRAYFEFVKKSDFLMGKSPPKNGKPPFRADFEWLIRPNNMVKVLESKYHSPKWWSRVSSSKTSSNWVLLSQIMEERDGKE